MQAELLTEAVRLIGAGGAICLVGAGFSRMAVDQQDQPIPSSLQLATEIRSLAGIDSDEEASLSDIADFCEDDLGLRRGLQGLLLSRLTLSKPSKTQVVIANAPWRALFTTNFDDVLEQCIRNRPIHVITPSSPMRTVKSGHVPLYYLHGRARDVLEGDKDPSLVISERNYLSLKDRNRDLYSRLANEVHCARAIFLIGYSARDLEIAQIFFGNGSTLRDKTYIVCSADDGAFARARLGKFGTLLPVGIETFSETINIVKPLDRTTPPLAFVTESHLASASSSEIEITDVESLILSGVFDSSKFLKQVIDANGESLYCVVRHASISAILEQASRDIQRFVVTSDIANGKSVFLSQLETFALQRGWRVFSVSTNLNEVFDELDTILAQPGQKLFIIDDVVRYRSFARFIGARLNQTSLLVCAARGDLDNDGFGEFSTDLGGPIRQVDLDVLDLNELQGWEENLERWGLWESRSGDDSKSRLRFLREDCGAENRAVILSIFRSSIIADRINQIVSFFLRDQPQHSRAFVALLISSLCQGHVDWQSVVRWCDIDDTALRNDLRFSEVFDFTQKRGDNWHLITSSQLAAHILQSRSAMLSDQMIVDVYTLIVRETAYSANDSRSGLDFRENLKELMKYRFLTRLFGENGTSRELIDAVYKRLSAVPRIRGNDQFWLQYAMARMEAGDLISAERYLNDALAIAESKGAGYSPHQILDQMVRLLFQKNSRAGLALNRREVSDATQHLRDLLQRREAEFIYQLRAIPYVLSCVECHADGFPPDILRDIRLVLENMRSLMPTKGVVSGSKKGESFTLKRSLDAALRVIEYI
jgi:hypothetical protein